VAYTFDCSSFGLPGNFILNAVDPSTGDNQFLANALAMNGSAISYAYTAGGTYHLEINSECAWTVQVTNAK
jgi:hypothetical protein